MKEKLRIYVDAEYFENLENENEKWAGDLIHTRAEINRLREALREIKGKCLFYTTPGGYRVIWGITDKALEGK